jgi:hypothetical protein
VKKIAVTILLNILFTVGILLILAAFSKNAHPKSSLYNIKRLDENVVLATKATPNAKAEYYNELLEKRFQEIETVYKEQEHEHLLVTALRYSSTAGKVTEFLKANNLSSESKKTKALLEKHKKRLTAIVAKDPRTKNEWKYIQDSINYLDVYIPQL